MRPLFTSVRQRLHRRHIKQAVITPIAIILVILALLPTLLTLAVRYQIPRMGLGQIEIGNIDINPFRGKILMEEVLLYRSAARLFSAQRVELDLAMLSLLEHRIHIQALRVDGLDVTLKQDIDGSLQIAGYPLHSSSEDNSSAEQTSPPWDFGIDALEVRNTALNLIHPQFPETVRLERISIGPLAMWHPDYPTSTRLRLGLRDATFKLHGRVRPFSQTPRYQLELEIDALPLAAFNKLALPVLSKLEGMMSARMKVELQQQADTVLALKQQGEVSLQGLQLEGGGHRLSQQEFSWDGDVTMEDLTQPETLIANGDLGLTDLALLPATSNKPYLSLRQLSLTDIKARGVSQLALNEVTIESLQAEAVRTSEGIWLSGMPPIAAGSERQSDTIVASDEATAKGTSTESKPLLFRIEQIRMSGENRLGFDDQTVKPAFQHALIITEAELMQLDNSQPEQPTRLKLKARDDFYTTIDIEGEIRPFAPQLSLNLNSRLQNYDMPPASPYLVQLLGYRITTGQLDSDVTLSIDRDELKGEIALSMNQLQLKPEDPARIEQTKAKLPLPLNTSLSLLRDRDDNIKLKLPISGKLSDPQFALDDIINTALGKALKAGSVSYLKLLFQPYGSLITVIQWVGKAGGSVQLDPVAFSAGSSKLPEDSRAYLVKLATLLNEKSDINIRLCGFATTADLDVITKSKEKAIPASGHPALEGLAKQRAEAIKEKLVNEHGVAAGQLFICHPELDRGESAKERVELSL